MRMGWHWFVCNKGRKDTVRKRLAVLSTIGHYSHQCELAASSSQRATLPEDDKITDLIDKRLLWAGNLTTQHTTSGVHAQSFILLRDNLGIATWNNAPSNPRWSPEGRGEKSVWDIYCKTWGIMGVRQKESYRPPRTQPSQTVVSHWCDRCGCVLPPSDLHDPSENKKRDTETGAKAVTHLSPPFTTVIECVILPVKRSYFCVWDRQFSLR